MVAVEDGKHQNNCFGARYRGGSSTATISRREAALQLYKCVNSIEDTIIKSHLYN